MSANPTTARKLGYHDYLAFPDDGLRHEIIDGAHYVTASPFTYHQTLSRRIQFQLYTQIELRRLGEVYDAPTCVQLSDVDVVEPDLIVVLRSGLYELLGHQQRRIEFQGLSGIAVDLSQVW